MKTLFNDYLLETNTAFRTYRENIDEKLNVCLGNVSCDMDSTIGVFILGYYLTHKNKYFDDLGNYDNLYLPVVNCKRGELVARLDISFHFQKFGIDTNSLIYIDDLDLDFYAKCNLLKLCIIDHNKLDVEQSQWDSSVKMIVDHHVDTHAYDNVSDLDKSVVHCGSACSMAMNLIFESGMDNLLDKELVEFFSPAILLDTENLKPSLKNNKFNQIDETACLKMFTVMMKSNFDSLIKTKVDRKKNLELGLSLILSKDYKNYVWKDVKAGISVIFNDFHEVINQFKLENLKKAIAERKKEFNLDFYFALTQTYDENDVCHREIMLYHDDINVVNKLKADFEKNCTFKLKTKKFTGLSKNFVFYIVDDESASRKKFEPIFKNIFETK